ncbi:MAG: hypothetical protein HC938_10645, partial [Nitrospira sp.]|nr:hypothetical protein [Nitrospira sp.]
ILVQQQQPGAGSVRQAVTAPPIERLFKGVPEERDLVVLLLRGKLSATDVRRLQPDQFSVEGCKKLVDVALTYVDRDGRIQVKPVLDQLVDDPDCGALVTELSLRDDHFDDELEHAKDCLDRLDRKRSDQTMRELITKIENGRAGRSCG